MPRVRFSDLVYTVAAEVDGDRLAIAKNESLVEVKGLEEVEDSADETD